MEPREIKLSCKCKEVIKDAAEFPDWPWINKDYFCMDCKLQISFEEIKND